MKPMFERVGRRARSRARGRASGSIARRSSSPAGPSRTSRRPSSRSTRPLATSRPADRDDHSGGAGADRGAPDRAVRRCRGGGGGARLARAIESRRLGEDVFSIDGRSMEEIVGDLLRGVDDARSRPRSRARGGLLLSRLTDVPGSSDYVLGGVVALQQRGEDRICGRADGDCSRQHGAVSEPVASAMAEGIRARTGATSASASPASRVLAAERRRSRSARSCSPSPGRRRRGAHVAVHRQPDHDQALRDADRPGHGPQNGRAAMRLFVGIELGRQLAQPRLEEDAAALRSTPPPRLPGVCPRDGSVARQPSPHPRIHRTRRRCRGIGLMSRLGPPFEVRPFELRIEGFGTFRRPGRCE